METKKPRSSMPASSRCVWARGSCARKPRLSPPSPRSALCGETSSDQVGELRVAVVARDVERAAAHPGMRVQVHAAAGDEELGSELVVALYRLEVLALVVI